MKILLVEDQDLERRRTKELLETNGFVVDQAAGAEEALSYARVYDYDAGIVDLHLTSPPTAMGPELIRAVRARRAYLPSSSDASRRHHDEVGFGAAPTSSLQPPPSFC